MRKRLLLIALLAASSWPAAAQANDALATLSPCRLEGVEHEASCGSIRRPLDPTQPGGRQIDIHFAVLPALARNKKPDALLFFAGGPGQSAIDLAGSISRMLGRFSNRRDLVLIDQRGTGRSAPLNCSEERPTRPLGESADLQRQQRELESCRARLAALPHGDLRQYTTTIAMQDADAVRRALGLGPVNLVGASYGTRAVLEYMRQFPQQVRRAVIDGVAPPDMVLPLSFSTDAQGAFDALLADCEHDAGCRAAYPALREDWRSLLGSLPRPVTLLHPVTLQEETLTLTRDMVTGMVRMPLYAPALAAALPLAIHEAARGRLAPLTGLASAFAGRRGGSLAGGMHLSVVCSEDLPLLERGASKDSPGPDFGSTMPDHYRKACAGWPRAAVPEGFYRIGSASSATLVLSGALDPVTPPRHGERVAQALGSKARHLVVPGAGHGVMALGCLRDLVFRFVDGDDETQALQFDAGCVKSLPRPPAFVPGRPPQEAR